MPPQGGAGVPRAHLGGALSARTKKPLVHARSTEVVWFSIFGEETSTYGQYEDGGLLIRFQEWCGREKIYRLVGGRTGGGGLSQGFAIADAPAHPRMARAARRAVSRLVGPVSRVEKHNEHFAIAFGVDHVTGAYVQVWRAPMESQEGAFLIIDSDGVHVTRRNERPYPKPDPAPWDRVIRLPRASAPASSRRAARGIGRPNLDPETAAQLFELFGFPGMLREVMQAFD